MSQREESLRERRKTGNIVNIANVASLARKKALSPSGLYSLEAVTISSEKTRAQMLITNLVSQQSTSFVVGLNENRKSLQWNYSPLEQRFVIRSGLRCKVVNLRHRQPKVWSCLELSGELSDLVEVGIDDDGITLGCSLPGGAVHFFHSKREFFNVESIGSEPYLVIPKELTGGLVRHLAFDQRVINGKVAGQPWQTTWATAVAAGNA